MKAGKCRYLLLGVLITGLAGCQTMPTIGQQGDVAVVDPKSRQHLQTELHMGDYLALSENVTNKMLGSPFVASWGNSKRFDYVIKSELTSSRQYGSNKQELVFITLQLKMFTLMGELKGQWSDDLSLASAGKRLY